MDGVVSVRPLRILMLHNYYQIAGGEDESFSAEAGMLEDAGHEVIRYTLDNHNIPAMSRVALGAKTIWNRDSFREISEVIERAAPDIVHAQNIFPLISPAVYYAAAAQHLPIVQSVRNYRLFCLNALFYRDGHPCEDCLGVSIPWAGIRHGCYRGSTVESVGVAAMLTAHRALGTWMKRVDRFIALSEFTLRKCIESGLPEAKLSLKPNFLKQDPGVGDGRGGYALYVGRLSPEKGIDTMLAAWRQGKIPLPLKVVGDGPLAERFTGGRAGSNVEYLGRKPPQEVYALMRDATLLVFPSEWYETFGRVAIEAFACGTPVVASRIGAVAELVRDGETGRYFQPGNAADLARCVQALLGEPERYARMRRAARAEYEAKYTAARNYRRLLDIYDAAIAQARGTTERQACAASLA